MRHCNRTANPKGDQPARQRTVLIAKRESGSQQDSLRPSPAAWVEHLKIR